MGTNNCCYSHNRTYKGSSKLTNNEQAGLATAEMTFFPPLGLFNSNRKRNVKTTFSGSLNYFLINNSWSIFWFWSLYRPNGIKLAKFTVMTRLTLGSWTQSLHPTSFLYDIMFRQRAAEADGNAISLLQDLMVLHEKSLHPEPKHHCNLSNSCWNGGQTDIAISIKIWKMFFCSFQKLYYV